MRKTKLNQGAASDEQRLATTPSCPEFIALPSPTQLAQIAATVGPNDNPEQAIKKAMKLFVCAVNFLQKHQNALAKQLEIAVNDKPTQEMAFENLQTYADIPNPTVPQPQKFPASLQDFFRLIVKAKTPADCMARLRDFLRADFEVHFKPDDKTPKNVNPDEYASGFIGRINEGEKKGGFFTEHEWNALGSSYIKWWRKQKSKIARESGRKGGRKRT